MLEHHIDLVGVVTLDDRWFPVLISSWWGDVQPEQLDAYFAWIDRQLARAGDERVKLVLVADARGVVRTSSATRQHAIAQTDAREASLREHMLGSLVVARGAFVLGLLAAVVGLVRRSLRISSFGEPSSALERALVKLDAAGLPRPPGLDPATYERPPRPPPP